MGVGTYLFRVSISGLEKPPVPVSPLFVCIEKDRLPENVLIVLNICIAGKALDIGVELADPSGYFLVTHVDACMPLLRDQVGWFGHELRCDAVRQHCCYRDRDLRIRHHLNLVFPQTG